MKKAIIAVIVLILVVFGVSFFLKTPKSDNKPTPTVSTETPTPEGQMETGEAPVVDKTKTVLGTSVNGLPITAYHFGEGETELLFVGGIHGGYEWNTALLAYEFLDYLRANPTAVPKDLKVTIIPVLNPDGLKKVAGTADKFTSADISKSQEVVVSGRFNANNVDLNRNFDCDWQAEGKWQNKTVSGGASAFSESESVAMKNYIEANKPEAVVVWYSSAGGVFASNCHKGVLPETTKILNAYSIASGYPAYKEFNFYEITGDMVNWLASKNVPAISVLLTDHTNTEWVKNKKGIEALFKFYAK
jgi:hypothetical protein